MDYGFPYHKETGSETWSGLLFREGHAASWGPSRHKTGTVAFIVMIDELGISNTELWKYVDDTSTSETVGRNQTSNIQTAVHTIVNRAATDKFQLN